MSDKTTHTTNRAPVIAIMGHVDHGKSKLLDYIRKSNVVEGEAGGITQHISAYEVAHTTKEGDEKHITFLDTPGHEAFRAVRTHGAKVADIAILVVASDEGVKQQTLEALETIRSAELPFIVALTKIDKPEANIERVKMGLSEHGIYAEDYGGDVPVVPISAISGQGISDLLDMILLVAELEEFTGDRSARGSGVVIEANIDRRKGISATLIIKDGTVAQGQFVVTGDSFAPVRIMENFLGQQIKESSFSMPVHIVGFNKLPEVGGLFEIVDSKRDAEARALEYVSLKEKREDIVSTHDDKVLFPLVVRADVSGSLEAIKHELAKIQSDFVHCRIIESGVGNINENDIKLVAGKEHAVILGFNTTADSGIRELADRMNVHIELFDIIYKLTEWVEDKVKEITPIQEIEETVGEAKILKHFSTTKTKQVVGGKVLSGVISKKSQVKIIRGDKEVGRGTIIELQSQKMKTDAVHEENEFGTMIDSREEIQPGDIVRAFQIVKK